eukprot:scaffold263174_cov31-Tisochrysis_lutea.AAC.1
MSTRPHCPSAAPTIASAPSVTDAAHGNAAPPLSRIRATTASTAARSRSLTRTHAPREARNSA